MNAAPSDRRDLVRQTLSVLAVLALISGCFWILKPFLPALLWASTIVVATWPLFARLEQAFGGRRRFAVAAMTLALLLVLVIPMTIALVSLVGHADDIASWVSKVSSQPLPPPPAWLGTIPLVGEQLVDLWQETAASGTEGLMARAAPYADGFVAWLFSKIGGVGMLLVQFLLTVVLSAVLYARGDDVALQLRRLARRLAGEQGESSAMLVAQTVRGVALGVVVTALVQAVLGGLGLAITGVPSVGILTGLMLVFGIAQVGPAPVLLAGVAWLYWKGETGWAVALLVWTMIVGVLDNVIRPALIRRGADLPFALVLVGVLGGLISLGVIGLFVGPVVLAVAYRLLEAWLAEEEAAEASSTPASPASPAA